jgi:hypothetical protein
MLHDYTSITRQDVTRVVDDAIATGDALIAGIVAHKGPRSWTDTMAPSTRSVTPWCAPTAPARSCQGPS